MIKRKGPDGKVYQFQDGTSEQVMVEAFTTIYGGSSPEPSVLDTAAGIGRAAGAGFTAGGSDEFMGWLAGQIANFIPESLSPYSHDQKQAQESVQQYERDKKKEFADESPYLSMGAEVTGSIFSPIAKATRLGKLTKLKPTGKSALDAMGFAMPYAFLSSDGNVTERATEAVTVAIPAALFGAGGEKAVQFSKGMFNKVFSKSVKVPTIKNLEESKNAAYKITEDLGENYTPLEMRGMVAKAYKKLTSNDNYSPDIDKQARASFELIKKKLGKDVSLTSLDKVRKGLWARHKSGTDSEKVIIRDLIDTIDDTMFSHAGSSEAMQAARLANSKFKKAELLDEAFYKAELQTAGSGSGGNILNKYKQAVTKIITNKSNSRWFDPEEISQMEKFVSGDVSQDTLRLIGKLSPTGNGLMTALNIGAIATNPAMAAVTVAGAAAKSASDRGILKQKEALEGLIRGVPSAAPTQSKFVAPVAGGLLSQ